jgi:hypothetical protein
MYLELTDVNSDLRAIIAPVVLGTAALGYTGAKGSLVAGTTGFIDRAKDFVIGHSAAAAATGIAAGVATVTAVAVIVGGANTTVEANSPRPSSVVNIAKQTVPSTGAAPRNTSPGLPNTLSGIGAGAPGLLAPDSGTGTPGGTTAGTSGSTTGGTTAGTSGSTTGGTTGGTKGGTSGSTTGTTSGGTKSGTTGTTSGGTKSGTTGTTSGGTKGGTSGSTTGTTSGGTKGGTTGTGTSGSTTGGTKGGTPGSTTGGTSGTGTSGSTTGTTTGGTKGGTSGTGTSGGATGGSSGPDLTLTASVVDAQHVRASVTGLPTAHVAVEYTVTSRWAHLSKVPAGCTRIDRTHVRCDLTAVHGSDSVLFTFRYSKHHAPAPVTLQVTPLKITDVHTADNAVTVTLGTSSAKDPHDQGLAKGHDK